MIPLTVGTTAETPERPAVLDGSRFNRHTFWCGQSGSGKTYALGVVLEQLLLQTELPVTIFDPNADFTELARTREDVDAADAARWRDLDIRVFHSSTEREPQLHIRFVDLSVPSKAAVGRLDAIVDEEEYNALLHLDVNARELLPGHLPPDARRVDATPRGGVWGCGSTTSRSSSGRCGRSAARRPRPSVARAAARGGPRRRRLHAPRRAPGGRPRHPGGPLAQARWSGGPSSSSSTRRTISARRHRGRAWRRS